MFKIIAAVAVIIGGLWVVMGPEELVRSAKVGFSAAQGWDRDACREHPVECLEAKQAQLEDTRDKLENSLWNLVDQRKSLKYTTAQSSAQADAARLLLSQARDVLNSQAEGPYRFSGGTYPTREALREQVKLLLTEYNNNRAIAEEGTKVAEQLKDRGYKIRRHIKKLESQIKIYPARIELARAQQHINSTIEAAETMDRVLAQADSSLNADTNVVTDAEGLVERSGGNKSTADVDEFLEKGLPD